MWIEDAGSSAQWSRSGCAANWQCVDDAPGQDGDSTYAWEWAHGEGDEYAIQDIVGDGDVSAVTVTAVARDIPYDPCFPAGSCPFYLQLTVNGYASPNKLLGIGALWAAWGIRFAGGNWEHWR